MTRTNRWSVDLTLAPCLMQAGWCACTSWNSSSSHSVCVWLHSPDMLRLYPLPFQLNSPPLSLFVFPFQNALTQVWYNSACLCLVRHQFRAMVFPFYRWNEIRKLKPTLMTVISLNTRKSYKYQTKCSHINLSFKKHSWKYDLLNFKMLPSYYGIPSN